MPDNNISKAQPSKAKGLGGVFPLRSKNAALLYMYRLAASCLRCKPDCGPEQTFEDNMFQQLELSSFIL